jgi:LacI family transcriptional regulator
MTAAVGRRRSTGSTSAAALARDLGVSRATISYALNGKSGVSDGLRHRILKEAKKRGLEVNTGATAHGGSVGLVLGDVMNPFYAELARETVRAARELDMEVLVANSDGNPSQVRRSVNALTEAGARGIILTTLNLDEGERIRELRQSHVPVVLLSRRIPQMQDIPFDGIDDFRAGRDLMDHVLGHGYRDIAIATGGFRSYATSRRIEGFLASAAAEGIAIPKNRIMSTELNIVGGDIAAEYLLGQSLLPEVVVCGADAIATGLINRLVHAGIRVPTDIAVVGFDGARGLRNAYIDLTTIVQPTHAMASSAIRKLVDLASGRRPDEIQTFHPHDLHVGSTCGAHSSAVSHQK